MDVCLRVLKESNKRRFDSYSVWNSVLIISHITFRDCRVHIFADNLSRNSCMRSARPDPLNVILHNIISHSGNAKLRLWFDGIFLKKSRVYFCAVVKYQLEHYKKRKGTVILSMYGRGILMSLNIKPKMNRRAFVHYRYRLRFI